MMISGLPKGHRPRLLGLVTLGIALLFAAPAGAQECARLERTDPGSPRQEVPMACEEVKKNTLTLVRQNPDVKRLAVATMDEAAELLGPPFHQYTSDNRTICFFREESFVAIHYDQVSGRPTDILFDVAGVSGPEAIPELLGLGPAPPPRRGAVGPVWNGLGGFAQVEVHDPEYIYHGEYVYPVILHITTAPVPVLD